MKSIAALQNLVTPWCAGRGAADAAGGAVRGEVARVQGRGDHHHAPKKTIDRIPSEVDERRIRRARNRVLAARKDLANRIAGSTNSGDAA
ncbi:DUF6284 family protein [Streptomyces virginiae]|uniref:DUF6284 family protein n=1 Tax=Streptomyces virginiae TaxID=1961 RepID=UPI0035DC9320